MIKVCSALLGVDDSALVKCDVLAVGINGYTSWLLVNCSLQLGNTLLWYMSVVSDLNDLLEVVANFAILISAFVWVIALKFETVSLGVVESVGLKTSIATFIAFGS